MQVQTKAYGTIEVDERQKIEFPGGIFGFENLHSYVLIDALQRPFYWLQSLEVTEVAFVLIDPTIFRPDYDPGIPKEELQQIGIKNDEDILMFAIVTIPEEQSQMTANLQGPIVIGKENRL